MRYDCIVIGGGISGLVCAIRLVREGKSCAIISAGMSALHFSSGSIDLFGYDDNHRVIYDPFNFLGDFIKSHPEHPYARCGIGTIREALAFLSEQLAIEGLDLYHNAEYNHFHVTPLGTLKPSYFSQRSVFNEDIKKTFGSRAKIAVLNFDGYRDFHPELALSNLRKSSLFKDIEIVTGNILYPDYGDPEKNPFEFRSIDIARIFDTVQYLDDIAEQIVRQARGAHIVGLPAFIGIKNFKKHHQILQYLTGMLIYEIPTLPPSILGMRIDDALKSRFATLGGVFIAGDRVTSGDISGGRLNSITTENYGSARLEADSFVLATGSFLSGGMVGEYNRIREPILDLKIDFPDGRSAWYSPSFFDRKSHPFMGFGVETNERLNPYSAQGGIIENLYCIGALLPHYNPIREGSGGGVAVSTGYMAASSILGTRGS